jgi:hypothetical protein
MGEVSAEEIEPAGGEEDGQALAAGAPASGELARAAFAALALLLGQGEADREAARRVGGRIAADHGYLPVAVGRALCYLAAARTAGRPERAAPSTGAEAASGAGETAAEAPVWGRGADEHDSMPQNRTQP